LLQQAMNGGKGDEDHHHIADAEPPRNRRPREAHEPRQGGEEASPFRIGRLLEQQRRQQGGPRQRQEIEHATECGWHLFTFVRTWKRKSA
jgi:hypothetical protein